MECIGATLTFMKSSCRNADSETDVNSRTLVTNLTMVKVEKAKANMEKEKEKVEKAKVIISSIDASLVIAQSQLLTANPVASCARLAGVLQLTMQAR